MFGSTWKYKSNAADFISIYDGLTTLRYRFLFCKDTSLLVHNWIIDFQINAKIQVWEQ